MNLINPFSVVKANEFTITQIIDNWVPFSGSENGFVAALNPQELMPKYVLGSKGCGKTHLLRYYSFEARLKFYGNDIRALLKNDKYLASYSRLDSLSSTRFSKNGDHEEWTSLYNYYFELIQSLVSLDVYERVVRALEISDEKIAKVIECITRQVGITLSENTIEVFKDFLNERRVAVDNEIIDYAYTKKLNWNNVRPVFTFGNLLFEIPEQFSRNISELQNLNYIYILDEYEKLKCEWQKQSLNSLVYEKKYKCTFWVGARKVGYTTRNTLAGEPIHEGHEFSPVDLDALLKANEKTFMNFAAELFKKRLSINGIANVDPQQKFEKFDEKALLKNLQSKGDTLKHWKTLKERLNSIGLKDEQADMILNQLEKDVEQDPVNQKLKLYSFYLLWSENKNTITPEVIESLANTTNHAYEEFKNGNNPKMKEWYRKFRQDFVAQLAEENRETLYLYSGFEKLVSIADCNPRIFLTLMKLIIEDCHFRGVDPFNDDKTISVRSQYVGINETAKWFLKDIEVYGKDRENLDVAINHLLNFMYVSRFCDKPTETSLCAFYYRMNTGQVNIDHIIELAIQEAFLMEVPNKRKDKTLGTPQKSFQVNRLIATSYNLPIARRGIISITPAMMSAIFDPDSFNTFNTQLTVHKVGLNAPFTAKKIKLVQEKQPSLFD